MSLTGSAGHQPPCGQQCCHSILSSSRGCGRSFVALWIQGFSVPMRYQSQAMNVASCASGSLGRRRSKCSQTSRHSSTGHCSTCRASTASSCFRCQADDPAMWFTFKTRVVQSRVAVACQLAHGNLVGELDLDHYHLLLRRNVGRKANLDVDPIFLLGRNFGLFEHVVARQVRNFQCVEKGTDATGPRPAHSASEQVRQPACNLALGQIYSPFGCEGVEGVIRGPKHPNRVSRTSCLRATVRGRVRKGTA